MPNEQNQKRNSSYHIIIKTLNVQNKERILKEAREKDQVIYKGRPTRLLSGDTEIQMIEQTTTAGKTINHNKCRKKNISQQKQIKKFASTYEDLKKALEAKPLSEEVNYTQENKKNFKKSQNS